MPTSTIDIGTNQSYILDARRDRIDLRDRIYQPPLTSIPPMWPHAQDITVAAKSFRERVLDQEAEGACTGFGLAAVINFVRWKSAIYSLPRSDRGLLAVDFNKVKVESVSPWQLYHLARIYDEWDGEDYDGSSCRGAVKGFHKHGVCLLSKWPEINAPEGENRAKWQADAAKRPLGSYYRIEKDSVADIQSAIFEVGAVFASAEVHAGWEHVHSNKSFPVIQRGDAFDPNSDYDGAHAFAIIGYEPRGFIIQNSWGVSWGFNGFAILPYDDWVDGGMDVWVTALGASREENSQPNDFGEAEFLVKDDSDAECENMDQATALCSFRRDNLAFASRRRINWFWGQKGSLTTATGVRKLELEEAYGKTTAGQ